MPGRAVRTQSQVGTEEMEWQSFSAKSGPRADHPTTVLHRLAPFRTVWDAQAYRQVEEPGKEILFPTRRFQEAGERERTNSPSGQKVEGKTLEHNEGRESQGIMGVHSSNHNNSVLKQPALEVGKGWLGTPCPHIACQVPIASLAAL